MQYLIDYHHWLEVKEEFIEEFLMDSGADRSNSFDPEKEYRFHYDQYREKNPLLSESDFRKKFNMNLQSDFTLQIELEIKAEKLRAKFLLEKSAEILKQKGISKLIIPSLHHFFKIAREEKIQEIYYGNKT